MGKVKSKFICQECNYSTSKWIGKCPDCQSWNSFEEEFHSSKTTTKTCSSEVSKAKKIHEIKSIEYERYTTGIKEFDRVVGGGLTKGSLTLLGGEPGIGKSTLLMKACGELSKLNIEESILYVSGEESESQIAERCKRLGVDQKNFYILNETNWQNIVEAIKRIKPKFFVLDSIQTTVSVELQAAAGAVSQIREVTFELMNLAKSTSLTCFVIGHVTKDGGIAGPKILEHMVDTVIYFEGDKSEQYRTLRVMKNRFGNGDEVGLFEMGDKGLKEVCNPSQYFLDDSIEDTFGRSLTCVLEGNRPILIEVQALVVENKFGNGKRVTQGVDQNRLSMLIAVLDKYFEIPISFNDVYLNVVGGMKLNSRDSDLAILAALLSSFKREPIKNGIVFIGEVGLSGEIRSVPRTEGRLKELEVLNYCEIIMSNSSKEKYWNKFNINLVGIKMATEVADYI